MKLNPELLAPWHKVGSNERWHHIANGRRPPPPLGWEETPEGAKTSTRLLPVPEALPVSSTKMLPELSTASPFGSISCPFPDPMVPNDARNVPLLVNSWTRLLKVSAT